MEGDEDIAGAFVRGLPDAPWIGFRVARLVCIYGAPEVFPEQFQYRCVFRTGQPDLGAKIGMGDCGAVFTDGLLYTDEPVCVNRSCEIGVQAIPDFIDTSAPHKIYLNISFI